MKFFSRINILKRKETKKATKKPTRKYQIPDFLSETHSQNEYYKWLINKTHSLVERDRKWLKDQKRTKKIVPQKYTQAIHEAVCECAGRDSYTGEWLAWDLLGKYDTKESKKRKGDYKNDFALLPAVDHAGKFGVAKFKICSWRTNSAKNNLSLAEFRELCKKVLAYK